MRWISQLSFNFFHEEKWTGLDWCCWSLIDDIVAIDQFFSIAQFNEFVYLSIIYVILHRMNLLILILFYFCIWNRAFTLVNIHLFRQFNSTIIWLSNEIIIRFAYDTVMNSGLSPSSVITALSFFQPNSQMIRTKFTVTVRSLDKRCNILMKIRFMYSLLNARNDYK